MSTIPIETIIRSESVFRSDRILAGLALLPGSQRREWACWCIRQSGAQPSPEFAAALDAIERRENPTALPFGIDIWMDSGGSSFIDRAIRMLCLRWYLLAPPEARYVAYLAVQAAGEPAAAAAAEAAQVEELARLIEVEFQRPTTNETEV